VRPDARSLAAIVGASAVRNGVVYVVLDTFFDNRAPTESAENASGLFTIPKMRYVKQFPDGHVTQFNGPQGPDSPLRRSSPRRWVSLRPIRVIEENVGPSDD
jgi:hypothetical protein